MAEETIAPETIEAAPEAVSEAQLKPNPIASYFQKKYYPNKSVKEVQEFIYSNKDNYDKAVNRMYDDTYAGKIDKSAFDAKLVQEYGDPFPAKKKVSTPDLPSISKPSGTPSVTSPKPTSTKPVDTFTAQPDLNTIASQGQADNYAPVTNPQVKQQLVAQDDAIRQKRKTEQDRLTQQLSKVVKEVPGMDKVLEYNSSRTPDVLREPTEEERAHQDFMKTRLGKVLGKVAYIGRGATKGTLQLAKGATTIMGDAFNTGSLGAMTKVASDYVYDKADENTNMGLSKSDINNYETNKGMSANGVRAASQVAELATTMLGGEAFSAPKAMFFLQGTGQGKETMDAVKKSGAKVNPIIEKVFPYATGAINGLLMGDLGETLFGKIPSNARNAVLNTIAADALEKSAGKELTGETFQALLQDGAKTFADKFEQTGIKALSHYNTTVKDLAKLQTANYLLKKGVDEVNDTPLFHENLGDLAEGLSKMATTEAPLFAATGVAKDAVHMLMPNSSFKNEIVNSLVENPTAENVDHIKKQLYDYGFDQNKTDKWSPEQMQATYEQVDRVAKIAQSLPKGLNAEKGAKAVDLINGRNDLKEQLAKLQEQKATLDPSLHNLVNPYEQNLADKIDQADDKLRTLATGNKVTYRAGTGDEDGKYFKKVEGKDEEISKSRYELEHFERNARSEANTEPVSEAQPQTEQTPVTQENVANSGDNEAKGETHNIISANVKTALESGRKKQVLIPGESGTTVGEEDFDMGDAEAELDRLELLAERGKLSPREFQQSYFGQTAATNELAKAQEAIKTDPVGFIRKLKQSFLNEVPNEQGVENNPVEGGVQENEAPADLEATRRQKAIDAIQHGIIGGHERPGETQARFDLRMDAADKTKALNDIVKGKFDTAPAKRMIEKVMDFDRNDEYPIIEGTGGNSFRNKSATAAEIQEHIDAAKQLKLNNNLSEAEIAESNKVLEELGITHDDIKQYEEYRASQEQPTNRSTTTGNEEVVPQSSNDRSASTTEDTGGQESQTAEPIKNASTGERAKAAGIELEDTVGETRTNNKVEEEAQKAVHNGYDAHDLVDRILNDKHQATDTEVGILSKHIDAKEARIGEINSQLEKEGATMPKAKFDELVAERDRQLNEFQDALQAAKKTGTETARALGARRFSFNREYSLADMIARRRSASGGEKLNAEQLSDVTQRFKELDETHKALEARVKQLEEDNAKLQAESRVKNTAAERLKRKSVTKEQLAEDRKQIYNSLRKDFEKIRKSGTAMSDIPYRRELAAVAKQMPAILKNLYSEIALEVGDKAVELKDIVSRLKGELKEDLPDITDRQVTDLIGGVYDEKKPTKSELSERVSSLKQQAKLAAQVEDLENGIKRVKPESSAAAKKNEQVEDLRKRLAELNKGEDVPKEVKDLNRYKKSKQDQIDELNKKIAAGDYSKPEPAKPVTLDPEALALRRKYDRLKHEFDVGVERDKLAQRTKTERLKDNILNIASLPRALKATLDFSAPGRQGLLLSIGHPEAAKVAMKEMFGQTFSEERYRNWLSDLKHTDLYDLMMNSDLYLSDKTNIQLLAREEMFTSNLAERIPVLGKAVAGAERAYTAYLNVIRSQVFTAEASKLLERGYTFENNPEVFKGIAKVINVLSGRGDIPEFLGGKQPAILSNLLFSPRFMASRIQTLYLWADPRLPKEARILAAKDIGKTLGTAATILTMAAMAGATVEKDPRSSDFLKIKVGNTRYDILGGLSPYVVFLSQELSGQKKPTSNKGMIYLNSKKFGSPTRASLAMNFMRGKLAPVPGMIYNLGEGKDLIGNEYHLWPNVPQEFVPLPFTDVYDAYKVGGWKNSLEVLLPAQFGIGVSSYDANSKKKH